MPQNCNRAAPERPNPEHVLTRAEIEEYGLEEAPADIGLSWEEITARRNANETN